MNYISADEFLNQSGKVQEEIWEWWKPEILDPVGVKCKDIDSCISYIYKNTGVIQLMYESDNEPVVENFKKYDLVPLLTEGQLIEFIENRTGGKIQVNIFEDGFEIEIYKLNNSKYYELDSSFDSYTKTRLKALWEMSIQIIEEE